MIMYNLSLAIAEILDGSAEFRTLCTDTIGKEFNYYVHIDMANVDSVDLPYFSLVTYTNKQENGARDELTTQLLLGIERSTPFKTGRIEKEETQQKIEVIATKALEVMKKDMLAFGLDGNKDMLIDYVNMYAPPPNGENDIQLQIDIVFSKTKCL